jgi:hypothetical protein
MTKRERWRGLSAILGDVVEHGTTAVERIHMATARRPFQIIEQIPPIAAPTKIVHEIHDSIVTNTYSNIRWINAQVQKVLQVALASDASDAKAPAGTKAADSATPATGEPAEKA